MVLSRSSRRVWIGFATFVGVSCAVFTPRFRAAEPTHGGNLESTESAADSQVDFVNDIVPVLTKLGCNAGACHGSAAGRGGFKLSLYGGDPRSDYEAIVHEIGGRRINLAKPEQSLVFLKPNESIAHEGGYLIEDGEPSANLLLSWIKQGALADTARELERVVVTPTKSLLKQPGKEVALTCTAYYRDGSQRDVTAWTVFTPEDESAVEVEQGVATVAREGRHIVVARYLTEVVPVELLVPLGPDRDVNLSSNQTRTNEQTGSEFIDAAIENRLHELRIASAPQVDELGLLRRLYLDLTGRLPPVDVAQKVGEQGVQREQLVDELLASEEFVEYWTYQFAKMLRIGTGGPRGNQDDPAANTYHAWLREQIQTGVGLDELVSQLVLATGDTRQYGPANFYRTVAGPREQAEFFSELFMGSRLRCANCHNHPLDKWTQDDYHGLAAIFAGVQGGDVVQLKRRGKVTHPRTLEPALRRIPGEYFLDAPSASQQSESSSPEDSSDMREPLVVWLLDSANPYFPQAMVNRLWKHMMGRGLVDPVDDFRATNPATHPILLQELANDMVRHGYSLRHTIKRIALSRAYSRGTAATSGQSSDVRFYSSAIKKPLEAEVLADAIADVLDVAESYEGVSQGTRAVTLVSPKTPSRTLEILGRCDRLSSCEDDSASVGGLAQKLHLLNGPLLNARIRSSQGRLMDLVDAGRQPIEIAEEFYLQALGRRMSNQEREFWNEALRPEGSGAQEQLNVLEDFVWSLLTCQEFVTNH